MAHFSPRSQAVARALARRLAWSASLALAHALAWAWTLFCVLGAVAGANVLLGSIFSFLGPVAPTLFPGQEIACAGVLTIWWIVQIRRARPLVVGPDRLDRMAFVTLISPFYVIFDRFGGFVRRTPAGPLFGFPSFDPPFLSALARLGALSATPPTSWRALASPIAIALSVWPASARQAPQAIFWLAGMLFGALLAMALFWLPLLGDAWGGIRRCASFFRPAALKGRAERATQALLAEGSQDLARAEAKTLDEIAAAPTDPSRPRL